MALRRRPVLACCVQFDALLKSGALSVADLPAISQRLGADGVEFREIHWRDKAAELPEVAARMRALGQLPIYATFSTLFNAEPGARAQLLVDLDDARALGSRRLRVFRGPWPAGDDVEMWQGARAAIERAADYEITLALENFVGVPGNHCREIQAALIAIGAPGMGTNLDTANYITNREDLLANIATLSRHIVYSHLKDTIVTGDAVKVVPIGQGTLPFDRIFALYDATGRDFPVTFEFGGGDDPERAIATSLEHLKKLGMPR
jgi:sugar phosphate isomerase/epimerase